MVKVIRHVGGEKVKQLLTNIKISEIRFDSNLIIVYPILDLCLDVNGGWGKEHFSDCSVCGEGTNGTRSLKRTCDNPTPGCQGNICPCNDYIEYESCDGMVATFRTESCADEPCRKLLGS